MLSYVNKILAPDEKIMYVARLHWIMYVQALSFIIAGGLLGLIAPFLTVFLFGPNMGPHMTQAFGLGGAFCVLIGVSLLLGSYIRQVSTELVVTNRRVIAKYGFMSIATFELMLSRVTGVNFDQTVVGRLLGYGTVIVRGAGGDFSPIDFIAYPEVFHNQLMAVVDRSQRA